MYAKVNELTKTKISTSKSSNLKDKNGNLLTKPEEIKLSWKEYIEKLDAKQNKTTQIKTENEVDICEDNKGPYIIENEILQTIKEMKDGKAAGCDKITAELIKNSSTTTIKKLEQICQQIYNEGVWPKDFLKTVMIPIEKKIEATDCIVLGILKKRITSKADEYLSEDQYGFRRGSETRKEIAAMRIICERSLEHDKEVNICFVDFEKAFDRIRWDKLMEILKKIGVDWRE